MVIEQEVPILEQLAHANITFFIMYGSFALGKHKLHGNGLRKRPLRVKQRV